MTRQEYEAKAANGTLTVGDVLSHREFATPEQLAIVEPQQNNRPLGVEQITRGFNEAFAKITRTVEAIEEQQTANAVLLWDVVGELPDDPEADNLNP